MNLRNRVKNPTMMRIGLVCMILASLSRWFLHPTPVFGQGLVDGTTGLLYGLSFACLLLSLRRAHRPRGGFQETEMPESPPGV
jgi:membrane associated rhomboid family serine protease